MGSTIALAEAARVEPLFLPEGWEIKVVAGGDDIDTAAPGGPLLSSDERTGEVVAIVGVTGIVDHVNDLIEPGAYADTLAKRRPKVCWAHSWEMPVGKVLQIEEWFPGDKRFAQVGATLDGKPWPAEAGALVAKTQFNMKSDRGREAFLAVDFYSDSGECEWSIGWQPIPQHTVKRKDGVRVCRKVELFEVSPVLFGAAPLTRTLQVKSLRLADAYLPALEQKVGLPAGVQPAGGGADENELHRLAMDEIDWSEVDAAATDAPPAEEPAAVVAQGDEAGTVKVDAKALLALTGSKFGDLDLDALAAALPTDVGIKAAEGGADRNRGNAEELRRWYEDGEGAAIIGWGTPGDFMRCVGIAGKHMTPDRAKGYCNLRHKGATGVYPGQEKSAGVAAAELLAKSWNPMLEVGVDAAHTERKYMGEGRLRGTFEQRREALDRALSATLRELHPAPSRESDPSEPQPVGGGHGWVSIDGTWEDRVVATFVRYGDGPSDAADIRQTYEVAYTYDGDQVELGTPRPVELQVSVVPTDGGFDDGDLEDAMLGPVITVLGESIDLMKAAAARTETKAGRVLSEANASRLRGALEHLLEVARAAGIDLPGWTGTDSDPAADGAPVDTTAPGTAAVAAAGAPATAVKTLSLADLQADLSQL